MATFTYPPIGGQDASPKAHQPPPKGAHANPPPSSPPSASVSGGRKQQAPASPQAQQPTPPCLRPRISISMTSKQKDASTAPQVSPPSNLHSQPTFNEYLMCDVSRVTYQAAAQQEEAGSSDELEGPAAGLRSRALQDRQYDEMLQKRAALKRIQWILYPPGLLTNQCSRWNIRARSSRSMANKCATYVQQVGWF